MIENDNDWPAVFDVASIKCHGGNPMVKRLIVSLARLVGGDYYSPILASIRQKLTNRYVKTVLLAE